MPLRNLLKTFEKSSSFTSTFSLSLENEADRPLRVLSVCAAPSVTFFSSLCDSRADAACYIFSLESRLSHPQGDDAEWGEDTNGSRATKRAGDDDSGGPAYIFSTSDCKGTQINTCPCTHRCKDWVEER